MTTTQQMQPLYFDYENQCWVKEGIIQACGHPEANCGCYGKIHAGEKSTQEAAQ